MPPDDNFAVFIHHPARGERDIVFAAFGLYLDTIEVSFSPLPTLVVLDAPFGNLPISFDESGFLCFEHLVLNGFVAA
jgi:hypothetical protein